MALKLFANSGSTVEYKAEELCASLNTFSGNKDYVIAGIGNQLNVVTSTSSLNITLQPGQAVICGRPVINDANVSFQLTAGTNYYLVLRAEPTRVSLQCVSEANLKSENINGGGSYHDLILGKYTATSSRLSSYTDMRSIKDKSSGLEYEVIQTL